MCSGVAIRHLLLKPEQKKAYAEKLAELGNQAGWIQAGACSQVCSSMFALFSVTIIIPWTCDTLRRYASNY